MKVERRNHPRGETGTRISLEETAKKAAEGRLVPAVRAWAQEKIVQAGRPRDPMKQAEAILLALRRERMYIPDPVDAEFIPSAACTLVGCEGLKFLGEDCDGLLVAFLAAIGSVGIEGAVVGHGYSQDGQLSHVLAGVFDGKVWHMCDPSTDYPFGYVDRPVRERWIAVPGINLLCDSSNGACDLKTLGSGVGPGRMRPSGDFVGVGSPVGAVGASAGMVGSPAWNEPWMLETLSAQVDRAKQALEQIRLAHARLQILRAEYMSRPIAQVEDPSAPVEGEWKLADENYYQSLVAFSNQAVRYGNEGLKGTRPVAWDAQGKVVVVGGLPGEQQLEIDNVGNMSISQMPGQEPKTFVPSAYSGQVGMGWLAAGVVVVVAVAAFESIRVICTTIEKKAEAAIKTDLGAIHTDLTNKGYSPAEADKSVQTIGQSISEKAAAQAKLEEAKNKPLSEMSETVKTVVIGAAGIALIGVLAYGIVTFTPAIKDALDDRRLRRLEKDKQRRLEAAREAQVIDTMGVTLTET